MANPGGKASGGAGCYCYILYCADGSFYAGWTTNPEQRLKQHNAGRGSRYTRARRPVEIAWLEPQVDRRSAMRRERVIKAMPRARKIRLIEERGGETVGKKRARARRSRRQSG